MQGSHDLPNHLLHFPDYEHLVLGSTFVTFVTSDVATLLQAERCILGYNALGTDPMMSHTLGDNITQKCFPILTHWR